MHEAKPSAVLELRLCPKCNNLRTCMSANGAFKRRERYIGGRHFFVHR